MPTYEITAPDGKTYEVTGQGTAAEALRHVQGMHTAPRAPSAAAPAFDPAEGMSPAEKMLVGAGASFARAGRGLGKLVGADTSQADADAKLYEKFHPGGWATAGEIGADIAMTALPSGAIARGATMLPSAMARIGANVAGQGAMNAAIAPDDRGSAFAMGAGGQVLGDVAQRVLPAAGRGIKLLTKSGREAATERRAGALLARELGDDAASTAATLRAGVPRGPTTADIPLNTVQTIRQAEGANPAGTSLKLAKLQLASARTAPDDFGAFLRKQNDAVYDATVNRAGADAGQLDALAQARDEATGPLRERALQFADREGAALSTPLKGVVDDLMARAPIGSPQRGLATLVANNLGEAPDARKLYELRKLLASKLNGPLTPGDEVAAITKGAERETMGMIKAIDARLQDASSTSSAVNQMQLPPGVRDVRATGGPTVHNFGEGFTTDPGLLQAPSGVNQRALFGAAGDAKRQAGDLQFERFNRSGQRIPGYGETVAPDQLPQFPREGQIDMFAEGVEQGTPRVPPRVINSPAGRLDEMPAGAAQGQLLGEEASPGRWNPYLKKYVETSGPVNSARAQRDISAAVQPAGGPLIGDNPQITRTVLKRAMDKFGGKNAFGNNRLTPEAQGRYDELATLLQRNEEALRTLKDAGTAGGGSQTAFQSGVGEELARGGVATALASRLPGATMIFSASRTLRDALTSKTTAEVAQMMIDPQRAAKGIEVALARNIPLTPAQKIFRQQMTNAATQGMQQGNRQ